MDWWVRHSDRAAGPPNTSPNREVEGRTNYSLKSACRVERQRAAVTSGWAFCFSRIHTYVLKYASTCAATNLTSLALREYRAGDGARDEDTPK